MKLYEFVDKLYAMGDMESPKTVRPKKTLNESYGDTIETNKYKIRGYNPSNGEIDPKELYIVDKVTHQRYYLTDLLKLIRKMGEWWYDFEVSEEGENKVLDRLLKELTQPDADDIRDLIAYFLSEVYDEEVLDEGFLGGLAGAALGGAVGGSFGHPVLGAIGGGLAGSAIQNALNDDLDESYDYDPDVFDDICTTYRLSTMTLDDIFEDALKRYGDEGLADEIVSRVAAAWGLNEDKDLSTVSGSMTQILQDNREKIDACSSAQEVHDVVAGLLAEAGLDTQATRRLLLTLKKQKGLVGALQAVYNSILKGSDLGVIKEGKEGPDEVAYTIVMIDNNQMNFGYVGWDPEADYYDVTFTNGLEEVEDWAFTAWDGDGTVNVYRFDTPEQAEHELREAQREFDEKLYVIAVYKDDRENLWFPVPDSFDEVVGGENELEEAANANPPRYQVKGCGKNGRVENHDQFMIFDSEYNDEIDYYDLCEIIRDVNEDSDLSSSQVEDIATDVISELYFQTPNEDLGEIISMYSY